MLNRKDNLKPEPEKKCTISELPEFIMQTVMTYAKENNLIDTPIGFVFSSKKLDIILNAQVKSHAEEETTEKNDV